MATLRKAPYSRRSHEEDPAQNAPQLDNTVEETPTAESESDPDSDPDSESDQDCFWDDTSSLDSDDYWDFYWDYESGPSSSPSPLFQFPLPPPNTPPDSPTLGSEAFRPPTGIIWDSTDSIVGEHGLACEVADEPFDGVETPHNGLDLSTPLCEIETLPDVTFFWDEDVLPPLFLPAMLQLIAAVCRSC